MPLNTVSDNMYRVRDATRPLKDTIVQLSDFATSLVTPLKDNATPLVTMTAPAGVLEQSIAPIDRQQSGEQQYYSSNATEYLVASYGNACQQIPVILQSKSIFCHGPYPKADFNEFQLDWQAGKGSCAEQGSIRQYNYAESSHQKS